VIGTTGSSSSSKNFRQTQGIEEADVSDQFAGKRHPRPKVRLAEGADPSLIPWPIWVTPPRTTSRSDLPAAAEGRFPAKAVRFPGAVSDAAGLGQRLFRGGGPAASRGAVPGRIVRRPGPAALHRSHDQLAVQWDVAVEFSILEAASSPRHGSRSTLSSNGLSSVCTGCRETSRGDAPVLRRHEHSSFVEPESCGPKYGWRMPSPKRRSGG